MNTKEALLHMTRRAYEWDEMSLLSAVKPWDFHPAKGPFRTPERDLTTGEAKRQPTCWYQSIWDILRHVAVCKAQYTDQAFGPPDVPHPEPGDDLESLLAFLDSVQQHLVSCIEKLGDSQIGEPVPTPYHGESAVNLIWVLAQHDVAHGAQIEVIRESLGQVPSAEG